MVSNMDISYWRGIVDILLFLQRWIHGKEHPARGDKEAPRSAFHAKGRKGILAYSQFLGGKSLDWGVMSRCGIVVC